MTKHAVIVSIAFIALNAGPVLAADLLLKAPALEAPGPIPGWGGFYVGGNVGYSRAKDDLTVTGFNVNGAPVPGAEFAALEPSGAFGGAQAGYNWQSSYWVYGFESDFQLSDEKASIASSGPFTASCHEDSGSCTLTGATGTGTLAANIDWFGTFRGRIGIAGDLLYWYATGGLAYGRVRYSGAASFTGTFTDSSATCKAGCPVSGSAAFADAPIGVGWTLGAGVEGVIPFWGNWTWRAEYLFVDLGRISPTTTYNSSVSIGSPPFHTQTLSPTMTHTAVVMDQVLRFGFNYRFGGEAPIVTKD
jgi:outer membrane immunogenic protein